MDSSQDKLIATDKSSKNRKATSSALNMPTELQRLRGMSQFSRFQDFKGLTAANKPAIQAARAGLALHKYLLLLHFSHTANSLQLSPEVWGRILQHSAAGWGRNTKDTVFLVDLMIRDGIANS